MTQKPSEFLSNVIGKSIVVKLNSGIEYRGFDCLMRDNDVAGWLHEHCNGKYSRIRLGQIY